MVQTLGLHLIGTLVVTRNRKEYIMSYILKYPYTEEERTNFIVEYNHNQGLRIETIDNFVEIEVITEFDEPVETTETELVNMPTYFALEAWETIDKNGEVISNKEAWEQEQIEARKAQFNKEFFLTSLGYVRRKVSMATGETKDFLSDLLPTISMGVNLGQPVSIITYNEPDFTVNEQDWELLQSVKTVDAQFVQECFLQLSNDFKPVGV